MVSSHDHDSTAIMNIGGGTPLAKKQTGQGVHVVDLRSAGFAICSPRDLGDRACRLACASGITASEITQLTGRRSQSQSGATSYRHGGPTRLTGLATAVVVPARHIDHLVNTTDARAINRRR